jgi:hypothetical protein
MLEIVRSFHSLTTVSNIIMQMKILKKQLLNKLQRSTRGHQKQETNEDDTSERERVTNQDARKFIAGL